MYRKLKTPDIIKDYAKDNRSNATKSESRIWWIVRNRKVAGLKFRRQVPMGRYIVDFLCTENKLILEVDGNSHVDRGATDRQRQAWLESQGYEVLRISNDDTLHLDAEDIATGIARSGN